MSRFEPSTMLAAQTEGKMLLKMYESLAHPAFPSVSLVGNAF